VIHYLRKSLPGRVMGLLILVLGLVNAATVYVFYEERGRAVRWTQMEDLVARSAAMQRLLDETPVPLHQQILQSLSTDRFIFSIGAQARAKSQSVAQPEHPLYQQLLAKLDLPSQQLSLSINSSYYWCYSWLSHLLHLEPSYKGVADGVRPLATVSIQRSDKGWLNGVLMSKSAFPGWLTAILAALSLFTLTVVAVVLIVRHVTRPLEVLTQASEQFGRGESIGELAEQGPEDVRRTTRAFNRMRDRLERYVKNRTQMFAAISHDLRTPLTSLRLQAEFIEDQRLRQRMLNTVDDMQGMTEATLAFTREDTSREHSRSVDLAALLQSLCDDLSDMGLAVNCVPAERLAYNCRPAALRRALTNLIENACYYGESAEVALSASASQVCITITDRGPGIAEQDWSRVFEPFVRLEASRNRNTGGIGLGLAIARTVAHSHGGDIQLCNLPIAGLQVSLQLAR